MDGHAVTGQNIPAVVIQESRHKVHLDVRTVVRGMLADDEAARFCDIGTAGALFPKQVAQTDRNVIEFIVGNGFPAVGQGADIQVILKVFTDARQVEPDFDTMRFQVIGGPDAGKHQ